MKKLFTLFFSISALSGFSQALQTFHDFNAQTINGNDTSMAEFFGKKILVVNTASYCAFTPQYTRLEQLYQDYQAYNFEIIGFPCNNFGGQEPGSDSTIIEFCENYDVTFTMMHRIDIITGDTAAIYKWLQRGELNGVEDAPVAWNFNKFLIDEAGHYVAHYPSATSPTDTAITNWILSPSVIDPLSVSKPAGKESITIVSANPASDNILLRFNEPLQNASIKIYSVDGRLVNSSNQVAAGKGTVLTISVSDFPTGIYLINIEANNFRQTIKQVIQR